MLGLALTFGLIAGRLDEHFYLLGLAPVLAGLFLRWGLSRQVRVPSTGICLALLGLTVVGISIGRWHEAEMIFLSQWEMAVGQTSVATQGVFDRFLHDEVGREGLVGFLILRFESGIRVIGDRGIDLGSVGGGVQWLFELGVCFWASGMTFGSGDAHSNTENFEHEAKSE